MAVEAGLADEELDAPAELARHALDVGADLVEACRPSVRAARADAGRRAILAEHLAQRRAPFAGGDAGLGAGDRGRHDVARLPCRGLRRSLERGATGLGVARRAPGLQPLRSARPRPRAAIDQDRPSPAESGEGSLSMNLLTPTTICRRARSPRAARVLLSTSCALHVADRRPRPRRPSRRCARAPPCASRFSSVDLAAISVEPSKMSPYSSRSVS